jgi:hypothetical protein
MLLLSAVYVGETVVQQSTRSDEEELLTEGDLHEPVKTAWNEYEEEDYACGEESLRGSGTAARHRFSALLTTRREWRKRKRGRRKFCRFEGRELSALRKRSAEHSLLRSTATRKGVLTVNYRALSALSEKHDALRRSVPS